MKLMQFLLVLLLGLMAISESVGHRRRTNGEGGWRGRGGRGGQIGKTGRLEFLFTKLCEIEEYQKSSMCTAFEECKKTSRITRLCLLNRCKSNQESNRGLSEFFCTAIQCRGGKHQKGTCLLDACEEYPTNLEGVESEVCKMARFGAALKNCSMANELDSSAADTCIDTLCESEEVSLVATLQGCNHRKFWSAARDCKLYDNPRICITDLCEKEDETNWFCEAKKENNGRYEGVRNRRRNMRKERRGDRRKERRGKRQFWRRLKNCSSVEDPGTCITNLCEKSDATNWFCEKVTNCRQCLTFDGNDDYDDDDDDEEEEVDAEEEVEEEEEDDDDVEEEEDEEKQSEKQNNGREWRDRRRERRGRRKFWKNLKKCLRNCQANQN